MKFVDDHDSHVPQPLAKTAADQEQLERFGGREQKVRRRPGLTQSLRAQRVSVADGCRQSNLSDEGDQPMFEVPIERSEWSQVEDADGWRWIFELTRKQRKQDGLCFARSCGRDEQGVDGAVEQWGRKTLDLGRGLEASASHRLAESGVKTLPTPEGTGRHGELMQRSYREDESLLCSFRMEVENSKTEAFVHRALPEVVGKRRNVDFGQNAHHRVQYMAPEQPMLFVRETGVQMDRGSSVDLGDGAV